MRGLLIFLLSFSAFAASDCDYHFSASNATIQILDASQVIQQGMSVYRGNGSPRDNCRNYRVFFSKGLANSYQRKAFSLFNGSINYNLHSNINQSGILKEYGDALNSAEFLEGQAQDRNTTYSNRFYVSIPGVANGTVRSGTFVDTVQISIYGYNESNRKYIFEETLGLTLLFVVPKVVQISVVDEGGEFNENSTTKVLDFGILAKGQEKGADLRVVSNSSYKVNVNSMNGGVLKQSGGSTIKYTMKVNGAGVALPSGGSSTFLGSGDETTSAGDRFNLSFQITDSTTNLPAGLYQDNLTITATAN